MLIRSGSAMVDISLPEYVPTQFVGSLYCNRYGEDVLKLIQFTTTHILGSSYALVENERLKQHIPGMAKYTLQIP